MLDRLTEMVSQSSVFIAMPGKFGTMAELYIVWELAILGSKECENDHPPDRIIVWRIPWEKCLECVRQCLGIPIKYMEKINFVDGVDDVEKILRR